MSEADRLDKRIWSAAKSMYLNSVDYDEPWMHLTTEQRQTYYRAASALIRPNVGAESESVR